MNRKRNARLIFRLLVIASVIVVVLALAACGAAPITNVAPTPPTVAPTIQAVPTTPPTVAPTLATVNPTSLPVTSTITPTPQPQAFEFSPENVTRPVTIEVPYQGHAVYIKMLPLPSATPDKETTHAKPGPNKGEEHGNDFYIWIINPVVVDAGTGVPITKFNPPLKITVVYRPEDLKPGQGQLSLIVAFQRENKSWKYNILKTELDPVNRTLTATIDSLDPNDPVGGGFP